MLVFDLHEGVSALLSDSDLDLLRRAPLRPHLQFAIKLIDVVPRTSLLLVILLLPAVIAFHAAFHLDVWGLVLLPVQALALWAVPFGLGAAGAIVMLRLVPARHAREALGLVSSLTLLVLWLANSFLLPRMGQPGGPLDDFRGTLARVALGVGETPGGWLGASLAAASAHDTRGAWLATARLVLAGGAALAAVMLAAHASLGHVQARIAGATTRRGRTGAPPAPRAATPTPLPAAMLRRDARLLGRNWTILGDLVTTVALWTLLPVALGPLLENSREMLARTLLLSLAVAVGSEAGARAVPLEREALLWARLAPVSPANWLASRYLGAIAISLALVAAATAGSAWALGLTASELLDLFAWVAPALMLSLAVGVWAGVAHGDPRWTNPRAMLRPAGRILSTILLVAQAIAWIEVAAHARGALLTVAAVLAAASLSLVTFADGARRLGRIDARELM
jgi:hypothetical protein